MRIKVNPYLVFVVPISVGLLIVQGYNYLNVPINKEHNIESCLGSTSKLRGLHLYKLELRFNVELLVNSTRFLYFFNFKLSSIHMKVQMITFMLRKKYFKVIVRVSKLK